MNVRPTTESAPCHLASASGYPPVTGPSLSPRLGPFFFSLNQHPMNHPNCPGRRSRLKWSDRQGRAPEWSEIALERSWCAALAAELGVNPLSLSRVPD